MTLGESQILLIEKVRNYLNQQFEKKNDLSLSSLIYFCSFAFTPGYAILKLWKQQKEVFLAIKVMFKEVITLSNLAGYRILNRNESINYDYKKIIITWANRKNFSQNQGLVDKYFNFSSNETEQTLWFVIYRDEILPTTIPNNVVLFGRKKLKIKYNPVVFINLIIQCLIDSKFSLKKFAHSIFWHSQFAIIVKKSFKKILKPDIKLVLMPYEGQTFQTAIISELIKYDKNIKINGYIHSYPSLPTHLVNRKDVPINLIISGKDQFEMFTKFLGWKKDNIKLLSSSRFLKTDFDNMGGFIFLPINIVSPKKIISLFKILEKEIKNESISKLVIKDHPRSVSPKKNEWVIRDLKKIFNTYKKKEVKKKLNYSVVVGATMAVIEALEKNVKVYHICEDPVLECYDEKLWPSIKCKKINENIFEYSLINKGNLIQFGNKDEIINNYLQ